jgi:hypothetical protein
MACRHAFLFIQSNEKAAFFHGYIILTFMLFSLFNDGGEARTSSEDDSRKPAKHLLRIPS